MPLCLVLSSSVATDRVGGAAQALVLAESGIDPVLIPTVVFGRHPGHGVPGGFGLSGDQFSSILEGALANLVPGHIDLILTGYFSNAEQVMRTVALIADFKTQPHTPIIVVDPILGDEAKGLYVKPEVAEAVKQHLVPLADVLTPNGFELSYISGRKTLTPEAMVVASRSLSLTLSAAVVTKSVPQQAADRIGVFVTDGQKALNLSHARSPHHWSGTGDLFSAALAVKLIEGEDVMVAAEHATRAVAEAVDCAEKWQAKGLSLVAMGQRLSRPAAVVKVERG